MLDNGYVYLSATRLSLYRSEKDWALVIEVFGFSPRHGQPDTHIHTFASRLHNRDKPEDYVNRKSYNNYLANNPNNESRFIFPVAGDNWINKENPEVVLDGAKYVLRGKEFRLPSIKDYPQHRITPKGSNVRVFEFCRFLASTARNDVLANETERRISVLPEMKQILQLEEWNHPDVVTGELPKNTETFQQLAKVLTTGELQHYKPSLPANTDWVNWPEGGLL